MSAFGGKADMVLGEFYASFRRTMLKFVTAA
jgi:hypothetical protein